MTRPENCPECDRIPTAPGRYCARCYCGHPSCPAFDTWVDLRTLPFNETTTKPKTRTRSRWDDRDGATWIDQL